MVKHIGTKTLVSREMSNCLLFLFLEIRYNDIQEGFAWLMSGKDFRQESIDA